jgi:hypothetical protein
MNICYACISLRRIHRVNESQTTTSRRIAHKHCLQSLRSAVVGNLGSSGLLEAQPLSDFPCCLQLEFVTDARIQDFQAGSNMCGTYLLLLR